MNNQSFVAYLTESLNSSSVLSSSSNFSETDCIRLVRERREWFYRCVTHYRLLFSPPQLAMLFNHLQHITTEIEKNHDLLLGQFYIVNLCEGLNTSFTLFNHEALSLYLHSHSLEDIHYSHSYIGVEDIYLMLQRDCSFYTINHSF